MRGLGAIFAVCGLLALAGCAPRRTYVFETRPGARVANIALDRDPGLTDLAEQFAERSDWPSVDFGYVTDEIDSSTVFSYDDQSFYDRLGGSFHRETESLRARSVER